MPLNNLTKQIILAELQNKNGWTFKKNIQNPLNTSTLKNIKNIRKIPASDPNQMVYEVTNKYVIKFAFFKHKTDLESFANELHVGWNPKVSSFGVNIYAYKASKFKTWQYGIYIMDHVSYGNNDLTAVTLHKYWSNNLYFNINEMNSIERQLFYKLKLFYKHTGGFHGDLHAKNIIVLLNKRNKVADIRIIDYGNFVPFDTESYQRIHRLNLNSNITDYMNIVKQTFNKHNKTQNNFMSYNTYKMTPIRYKHSGLPFRSNKAMLNEMNIL
mgnify:CR=1 FL=1|tara:strand:+ start:6147 stop:6956 length:810 start_codon:yes stop_codon:yes gene_type:complete